MRRRETAEGRVEGEGEVELAARAAWLYHVGGLLQAEVAKELDLSLFKVNRLIAHATERGIVRVMVDGPIADCMTLEQRLMERFGLAFVRVVPDLGDKRLPLRALGIAAAGFLHGMIESKRHRVIGVGHGRTLWASRCRPARHRTFNSSRCSAACPRASAPIRSRWSMA
jgi:DNA-binding transcriptional regulator LsrR (DeoR family)